MAQTLQDSLNADMTPYLRFARSSPYTGRNGKRFTRFKGEFLALIDERLGALKPGPGRVIDIDGRHKGLTAFREYVAEVYEYDGRLGALENALRLTDGVVAGEVRAIFGRIGEDTDPERAFNDLVVAANEDLGAGVPALRTQVATLKEAREQAEREAAAQVARVAGLQAQVEERQRVVLELTAELARRKTMLRFEPDEPEPEAEPEQREETPPNVRPHGTGYQAYKKFNGSPKQWQGAIWPTVAEAQAELDEKVREMGKQAADERLQQERAAA